MVESFYILNFILALAISVFLGPFVIRELKNLKVKQSVLEDGPKSHAHKSGTPTMGGIIFMISSLITIIVLGNRDSETWFLIISMFAFGAIGFLDDYVKVSNGRNLGLTAKQKLACQIIIAFFLILYKYRVSNGDTTLYIPFTSMDKIDIGILFFPFMMFVMVGTVNAVNLTDGLDGLASGVSTIVLFTFSAMAVGMENESVAKFSITLAGALLGFLVHNKYPAKVFMGDAGSLALGGVVGAIVLDTNLTLFLPIIGGIFFIETLSVIIQVASFKLTGKRVFLMAPLHHHFEEKGWKEVRVVWTFYAITVVLCLIGIYAIN
ncbi:MAG: phospho-N-acetylmuramoyl-pentapeptide-transferase [Tissierellia bacterium]|nr:phospho-N-acetylmuramoyl-pentapeptide-transferase [Tissierellia bacterium]